MAHFWIQATPPRHAGLPTGEQRKVGTLLLHRSEGDVQAAVPGVGARAPSTSGRSDGAFPATPSTERLAPPSPVREALGSRRPSGWGVQDQGGGGPGRTVLHAPDGAEAPQGSPRLPLKRVAKVASSARRAGPPGAAGQVRLSQHA